jgi:hypothetical protein
MPTVVLPLPACPARKTFDWMGRSINSIWYEASGDDVIGIIVMQSGNSKSIEKFG